MRPTLYLIDGTALLYRSHFAFIANPLVNSKGQHTSAIFGVINSFLRLLELKHADHILISFDRKAPTFRHELSEAYKANRPPMPDDLIAQIEPVKQFFELIGLPEISLDGYEADDVLATLAERYKTDYDVVLVTSDKDYSQLVEAGVSIWDPAKDVTLDSDAVFTKFGVRPEQFIDYLALVGDASDNIPGVKGIGPKGAVDLLTQFGSLDQIFAALEQVSEKYRKKLEADKDAALLSRTLATIIRDVPIEPVHLKPFDASSLAKAADLLSAYELLNLKRRMESRYSKPAIKEDTATQQADIFSGESNAGVGQSSQSANEDVYGSGSSQSANGDVYGSTAFKTILATPANFPELLSALQSASEISIDTETDSIDPIQANLVGISLCYSAQNAWYLPLGHQLQDNLLLSEVVPALSRALDGKLLSGHNLKYDLIVLERHGWKISNPIFDTMLAAYVLEPGTNQYSLDACAARELHNEMIPITAIIGSGKNQITFDLADPVKAAEYAAEDAWAVFRLTPIYRRRLEFTGLHPLYQDIELPLIRVLKRMEQNGVALDSSILRELSASINTELKRLTDLIYDYAGYQFNLNSTQQLAKLLFEEKGLPTKKKTKSGFSTDSAVLEELADDHEIARLLIQYRMLSKLESTYVNTLPKLINPATQRVHSSFNQTVASTGRLSSSNPNLQNIPIRTELGRQVRKAFVASAPNRVILAADYSQIELRLLGLFSKDEVLLQAFRDGLDIHRQTAAYIHNKPLEEVSSDERRGAKTINFGLLYGMGQKKLSRELGISLADAKEMIRNYFERFPTIRDYIRSSIDAARQNRYCETLFGRKLYLPNINSNNQGLKSEAERVSVNMPIQGSAADLIKIAMLDIHAQIKAEDEIRMVLQVHDELVFDVLADRVDEASHIIRSAMENALPQQYRSIIHLQTDIGVGRDWYEAH